MIYYAINSCYSGALASAFCVAVRRAEKKSIFTISWKMCHFYRFARHGQDARGDMYVTEEQAYV